MRRVASLLAMWFAGALGSRAQSVAPISYAESSAGSTGLFTYFDTTPPSKLTDGVLGVDAWQTDLGNGAADEWVAWTTDSALTFTFTGSPTVHEVQIGFNRDDLGDNVVLPGSVMINGTNFTIAPDAVPEQTRAFLNFDGTWTGNTLEVDLTNVGGYIFVDEVRFSETVSAIPEPAAGAALLGLAMLGIGWRRRRSLREG